MNLDPETLNGQELLLTYLFCPIQPRHEDQTQITRTLISQAKVVALAFKVFHNHNEHNQNHRYQLLFKALQQAPDAGPHQRKGMSDQKGSPGTYLKYCKECH